jgi:hypothetical protein
MPCFEFIDYEGLFTPEAMRGFLRQHGKEFDCVVVQDSEYHADARQAAEEEFNGVRIICGLEMEAQNLPLDRYQVVLDVRTEGLFSEFERRVTEQLRKT